MQTINTTYKHITKKLSSLFIKIGINTKPTIYYNNSILFTLNRGEMSIFAPCYNDKLSIKYDLNKDLKQIVLSIREEAYTYKHKLEIDQIHVSTTLDNSDIIYNYILEELTEDIPSHINNAIFADNASDNFDDYIDKSNYSSFKKKIKKDILKAQSFSRSTFNFDFTFALKVPKRTTNLLIGYDHDSKEPFICQLPKFCQSVKAAHNSLIPKEAIGKKYLRQGEWFFIPVTNNKEKNKIFVNDIAINKDIQTHIFGFNNGKNHVAELICSDTSSSDHYVRGEITSINHDLIKLNSWHKVVRNREIINREKIWD